MGGIRGRAARWCGPGPFRGSASNARLTVQATLFRGRVSGQGGQPAHEPCVAWHGAGIPASTPSGNWAPVRTPRAPLDQGELRGDQLQEPGLGEPAPVERDAGAVPEVVGIHDGEANRRGVLPHRLSASGWVATTMLSAFHSAYASESVSISTSGSGAVSHPA